MIPQEQLENLQAEFDATKKDLAHLKSQEDEIGNKLMLSITNLVQTSMAEVSSLNNLLVPLISLMRTELELPFNSEHFAQILEKGNQELENYMASFFDDVHHSLREQEEHTNSLCTRCLKLVFGKLKLQFKFGNVWFQKIVLLLFKHHTHIPQSVK